MDNLKLLIIDDEKDYCQLLDRFFSRKGMDVTICHVLRDGLNALATTRFDCVILDNNLPDGLGWDHADDIAQSYGHIKLVLVSAHPRKHSSALPLNASIWEKPVSLADLKVMFDLPIQ